MDELGLLPVKNKSVIDLLELSNWAEDFTSLQFGQLSPFLIPYLVREGTTLIKEGSPGAFVCLICEGNVDIVKECSNGTTKKLLSLGAGKVLGEMSFFDKAAASATAIIQAEASVLIMNHDNFNKLSEAFPRMALTITLKILCSLSQRLRQTSGKLIDFL